MPSYESVTVLPGWADVPLDDVVAQVRPLMAKKCVLFVFVGTSELMEAGRLLQGLTGADHGAYVFKLWHRLTNKNAPKLVQAGPRGCVLTDSVQVWALQPNRANVHDTRSPQTVASKKIADVVDHIADHVNTAQRLAVVFGGEEKAGMQVGSTEFDVYSVAEKGMVKKKAFTPASARKSRMLRAYVETQPAVQLGRDRRMLALPETEAFTDAELVVRQMAADSLLPPGEVDQVLKKAIARKRRAEAAGAQGKGTKRKRGAGNSGIAAVCQISEPLRHFLTAHCEMDVPAEGVPRTDVVRAIPAYVKRHGLNEGRRIHLDDNLRALIDHEVPDDEVVTFFNIYKHINHNFLKAPAAAEAQ